MTYALLIIIWSGAVVQGSPGVAYFGDAGLCNAAKERVIVESFHHAQSVDSSSSREDVLRDLTAVCIPTSLKQ